MKVVDEVVLPVVHRYVQDPSSPEVIVAFSVNVQVPPPGACWVFGFGEMTTASAAKFATNVTVAPAVAGVEPTESVSVTPTLIVSVTGAVSAFEMVMFGVPLPTMVQPGAVHA